MSWMNPFSWFGGGATPAPAAPAPATYTMPGGGSGGGGVVAPPPGAVPTAVPSTGIRSWFSDPQKASNLTSVANMFTQAYARPGSPGANVAAGLEGFNQTRQYQDLATKINMMEAYTKAHKGLLKAHGDMNNLMLNPQQVLGPSANNIGTPSGSGGLATPPGMGPVPTTPDFR